MAKKYSIHMEDDKVVSVEIDGVRYKNPDQIPDADDRARVESLLFHTTDMEMGSPAGGPDILSKIMLPLFLTIAVVMLVIAAVSAFNTARAISKEKSAQGQVIDLITQEYEDGSKFSYPVVVFALPDESRQMVQLSGGTWPPAYEKGELVTVLYDPEQPTNARIKSFWSSIGMWTLAIITGFMGAAFLIATWFVYWMLKSDKGPWRDKNES